VCLPFTPQYNVTGAVSGSDTVFIRTDIVGSYTANVVGTMSEDGNTMSGTWTDSNAKAGSWTAVRVTATVAYTGGTLFAVTDDVMLAATLTDSYGAVIAGVTVGFKVGDTLVGSTPTDSAGVATFNAGKLSAQVYEITASAPCAEANALVVVYDPSAGFVTGGGWITSPEGAYTEDSTMTGKATFGFVSKYLKGATVPTGNTQFIFHAAGFSFQSTAYDWLVVAGTRAQYKGIGTVNGEAGYGFMLTAVDGGITGDMFRIKVWAIGGDIVYDNMLDAEDGAAPTTTLGGGSIVIHTARTK